MTWGPQWFVRLPHWFIMRALVTITCVVVLVNTYLTAMPWLPDWARIPRHEHADMALRPLPGLQVDR